MYIFIYYVYQCFCTMYTKNLALLENKNQIRWEG